MDMFLERNKVVKAIHPYKEYDKEHQKAIPQDIRVDDQTYIWTQELRKRINAIHNIHNHFTFCEVAYMEALLISGLGPTEAVLTACGNRAWMCDEAIEEDGYIQYIAKLAEYMNAAGVYPHFNRELYAEYL